MLAAIFQTGRDLIAAKANLAHGNYLAMVENDLAFSDHTARIMMAVARDSKLANRKHVSALPQWCFPDERSDIRDNTQT